MKNFFVVGFPRSGTTLLQSLISQSPEIISFPETHLFFREFIHPLDRLPISPQLSDKYWILFRGRGRSDLLKALPDIKKELTLDSDLIRSFTDCMERYGKAQGYTSWLEKTPGHVRRIPVIKTYYKDAKFIHIIRRFQAIESSWQNASKFPGSPFKSNSKKIFRNWKRDINRSTYWAEKDQRSHFVVFYPRLCAEPRAALREISSFLDTPIPYDLDNHKTSSHLVFSEESWKTNNKKKIFQPSALDLYGNIEDKSEVVISTALKHLKKLHNIFL